MYVCMCVCMHACLGICLVCVPVGGFVCLQGTPASRGYTGGFASELMLKVCV